MLITKTEWESLLDAGAIALATGYHAAFLVCAVFAALGVAAYLITEKKFFGTIGYEPDDPLPADRKKSFIVKMIAAIVVAIAAVVVAVTVVPVNVTVATIAMPDAMNFVCNCVNAVCILVDAACILVAI